MTPAQQSKAKLERVWEWLYKERTEARTQQDWEMYFAASEDVARLLRDWRRA